MATGASIVIAPGGAFRFLMMDYEGYDMARALTAIGMTAFVLRYRLMRTPADEADMRAYFIQLGAELPIQDRAEVRPPVGDDEWEAARLWAEADGLKAVRWVRAHAQEFALDPLRIGIAGFSAGGGVAVSAGMLYDAESRPDFVAGIYPAYRRDMTVPTDAPPLFLAAADGDVIVSPGSTAALYQAWHNAGRVVELHIFSGGEHGFGMYRGEPNEQWFALFQRWLDALSIHNPARIRSGDAAVDRE
jgi:acetyl esterase/lipase